MSNPEFQALLLTADEKFELIRMYGSILSKIYPGATTPKQDIEDVKRTIERIEYLISS